MPSIEDVLSRDMCTGCGGCGVATGGRIPITLTPFGQRQAILAGVSADDLLAGSKVCPFAHESPSEDEVAAQVFPENLAHDGRVGRYLQVSAARATSDDYLLGSSSGGMTSWIAGRLLSNGDVDGVIHVGQSSEGLFGYTVSYDLDSLVSQRKSVYYSTSFADTMSQIRGDNKRYALIGVPCFITSARHLAREDPEFGNQLAYFIGLVCGHLKTSAFAELLAWQTGVTPDELVAVDFRVKYPHRDAGDYGFGARKKGSTKWRTRPVRELLGSNWGHAMLQLNACNFCDDIFAETADVVLGDAWLDGYREDWRGTNVVITRNTHIQSLIDEGRDSGELMVDPLSVDDAASSQGGNFRHRRDGLAVRLADDQKAGLWIPRKRVKPDLEQVPAGRRALIRQRRRISDHSHAAFAEAKRRGSWRHFAKSMKPLVDRYTVLDLGPILGNVTVHVPWLTRSKLFRRSWVRKLLARKRTTGKTL